MAINEISVTTMVRSDTADASPILAYQAIDSATGAYIDVSGIKGDRLALMVSRDTEAKDGGIRIAKGNRSGNYDHLVISLTTDNAGTHKGEVVHGPIYIETARHKDSNDRINIYAAYSSDDLGTTPTTIGLWVAAVYLKDM